MKFLILQMVLIRNGEIIYISPVIRSLWADADNLTVEIGYSDQYPFQQQDFIEEFVVSEISIPNMSAYSTYKPTDNSDMLQLRLSNNLVHNESNYLYMHVKQDGEIIAQTTFEIKYTNSIVFDQYITNDFTLLENQEYIVSSDVVVIGGSKITIEPGVTLRFENNARIALFEDSYIYAVGEKDNFINVIGTQYSEYGTGFNYTKDGGPDDYWRWVKFTNISLFSSNGNLHGTLEDCIIDDSPDLVHIPSVRFKRVNIMNSWIRTGLGFYAEQFMTPNENIIPHEDLNFVNNIFNSWAAYGGDFLGYMPGNTTYYNLMPDVSTSSRVSGLNVINNFYGYISGGIIPDPSNQSHKLLVAPKTPGYYSVPSDVYLGTSIKDTYYNWLFHDFEGLYEPDDVYGIFDFSHLKTEPFEGAHGIVWKVEVNGKDAQDEYDLMDPIGVGTHEFKVYFNREMDTSVNPQVSYGVTIPYNQKIISEEGSWSEDGKIYTVNHDVNIGAADGINRIRVQDAQDLDYFKIPVEDYRFNILVQSAGSASTGFFATPGLGKIALEWAAPSADALDDVLGYNMYRYQVDADGNEGDPTKLNESLIIEDTDESTTGVYFTDYDVVEGETYFYKYKILRTSFEETDYSNAVSASPLTSLLGDSNGDFAVNVLDLVHDVDYILGNNPTPFIFVAGDVNADETINVLDIVGTVDIILTGDDANDTEVDSQNIQFYPSTPIGYARFTWEGDELYIESEHNIGGIQLAFDQDFEYVLNDLPGIERLDYEQEDQKVLMLYSFNNNSIASSKTKLLTRINSEQEINIDLAVVGTTTGSRLTPVFEGSDLDDIDSPLQSDQLEFMSMIPNPSDGLVTLKYYLPEQMDGVVAKVYDMLGRMVYIQPLERVEGESQVQMQLDRLQKGNYIVLITADKDGGLRHIANKILVIK